MGPRMDSLIRKLAATRALRPLLLLAGRSPAFWQAWPVYVALLGSYVVLYFGLTVSFVAPHVLLGRLLSEGAIAIGFSTCAIWWLIERYTASDRPVQAERPSLRRKQHFAVRLFAILSVLYILELLPDFRLFFVLAFVGIALLFRRQLFSVAVAITKVSRHIKH